MLKTIRRTAAELAIMGAVTALLFAAFMANYTPPQTSTVDTVTATSAKTRVMVDQRRTISQCATEDGEADAHAVLPCWWDASAHGTGEGTSFLIRRNGRFVNLAPAAPGDGYCLYTDGCFEGPPGPRDPDVTPDPITPEG